MIETYSKMFWSLIDFVILCGCPFEVKLAVYGFYEPISSNKHQSLTVFLKPIFSLL